MTTERDVQELSAAFVEVRHWRRIARDLKNLAPLRRPGAEDWLVYTRVHVSFEPDMETEGFDIPESALSADALEALVATRIAAAEAEVKRLGGELPE